MRGYSVTNVFTKKEQALYGVARVLVESLPEIPGLRCHELTRAVGVILGLEVQDGHHGMADHSWLLIPATKARCRGSILDVYSVGSLPLVRICDIYFGLPHEQSYKPLEPRDDIDEEMVMRLVDLMQRRLL